MLSDVSRSGVLRAIAEYDELGQDAFLERYGFRRSREYFLVHEGRRYDSKAIVGAAHGYDHPTEGALTFDQFSGGLNTVAALLNRLGFDVESGGDQVERGSAGFWWVNQGQTYRAEFEGGYIWAPQQAKNGTALKHHTAVASVVAGDRIVHYADGRIRAISIATADGREADRPSELPGESWSRPGYRADVNYFTLDEPVELVELDATLRAGAGGPFNSHGGVNQGYLYPLPEQVRAHLMSKFADRLPIELGTGTASRLIAVYVGQASESNFHFSSTDGIWGWKVTRDDYSLIRPGDRIAFAIGFSAGSPRVQASDFLKHRLNRMVLGTVTSELYHDATPYWPDERSDISYPHRIKWDLASERENVIIADLDEEFGGPVAEGFRRSAIAQGMGVIVDVKTAHQPPAVTAVDEVAFDDVPFSDIVQVFHKAVQKTGLSYSEELTRIFLTSLATKRFLILTGLSGSGKTRLAQSFGEWLGSAHYLIVPVRPDWTSPDALLGYENGLSTANANGHAWNAPEALRFMLAAAHDSNRPYLLVLDEMNLAHVERYFADVLSGMETGAAVLPNLVQQHGEWRVEDGGHALLPLPNNLFVVGTVNVDETTYMFSPKVLDRANTIEFRVGTHELTVNSAPLTAAVQGEANLHRSFLELARAHHAGGETTQQLGDWLTSLHALLRRHDREFGHRVFQEALRFADLYAAAGVEDPTTALDVQVMQKILPKFHGSIRELNQPLNALAAWTFHGPGVVLPDDFDAVEPPEGSPVLPRSFDKIQRMARRLRANHFVSFAE